MYQFYIFEIKKNAAGEYEHDVHWAFDSNADRARLKGESEFYKYCSDAALSDYPHHTVTLFSSDGDAIMNRKFVKPTETEPEETTAE